MPNHVLTEIVFSNVSAEQQDSILSLCAGKRGAIDFETLLPIPLNVWQGNVGTRHEGAFRKRNTALEWCTEHWGTKWDAYGIDQGGKYQSVARTDGRLVLTFQTAWRPPYGWLLALWHKSGLPFSYTYLDEGAITAKVGRFTSYDLPFDQEPWSEENADEPTHRRMHKLMWGVEEFEEEVHDAE